MTVETPDLRETLADRLRDIAKCERDIGGAIALPLSSIVTLEAAAADLDASRAREARMREALEGVLAFAEDAETKVLVGDEGCVWAVEFVRTALQETQL